VVCRGAPPHATAGRAKTLPRIFNVIAEGIETDDQHQALRRMSCAQGQGYHFARPQDAARTAEILAELDRARTSRGATLTR
jgi:sensor c-di-GMP phosphodiesterase-like protein